MNSEIHEGGCLCGAIRFKSEGRPASYAICHCELCQRVSGSAFCEEVFFPNDAVTFEGAEPGTYTYVSPDHGRTLTYTFCANCGNRLGVSLERFPDMFVVYVGTYDDSSWVEPTAHVFTKHAREWIEFPSNVDCYLNHLMNEDGSFNEPV